MAFRPSRVLPAGPEGATLPESPRPSPRRGDTGAANRNCGGRGRRPARVAAGAARI